MVQVIYVSVCQIILEIELSPSIRFVRLTVDGSVLPIRRTDRAISVGLNKNEITYLLNHLILPFQRIVCRNFFVFCTVTAYVREN